MATTKTVLQLEFLTDTNKKVRITIPNPKQPVDNTAVDTALSTMVAKSVFALPQGKIVSSVGASQVQTDATSVG